MGIASFSHDLWVISYGEGDATANIFKLTTEDINSRLKSVVTSRPIQEYSVEYLPVHLDDMSQ